MSLNGIDERLITLRRCYGFGQEKAVQVDSDTDGGSSNNTPNLRFEDNGIFLGVHTTVELGCDLAWYEFGVGAAYDVADVKLRVVDAADLRMHTAIPIVERVQDIEDAEGSFNGINACVGNGGVSLFAVDCDFHLQAPVVSDDHLIREAGGNEKVRLTYTLS